MEWGGGAGGHPLEPPFRTCYSDGSLMKLFDIRRLAIEQTSRVRFTIGGTSECIVDEHGVARIPGMRAAPDFNLETELASVQEFQVDAVLPGKPGKQQTSTRRFSRGEFVQLCERKESGAHVAADHDNDE